MDAFIRLGNDLRSRLRKNMVGRAILQARPDPPIDRFCIVSATRLSEKDFWRSAALGRSLMAWRKHPALSVEISFNNKKGLPLVYNAQLRNVQSADALLFLHDDLWIDDPEWMSKVKLALGRFDIVGIAGNMRISRHQPAWLFSKIEDGKFIWDTEYLSGGICHGKNPKGSYSLYGPTPVPCELLDGVFLAVNAARLRRSKVFFDERFSFDFYDMDLCRRARQMGLSLGTWPIALTHQSEGAFGGPSWDSGMKIYFDKWKS